MAAKKDNRLAWGVSLLVFGCLFLLRQFHLIPADMAVYIFDVTSYLFIIGIIFLICHSNKSIGWILVVLGILFRLSDIVRFTQNLSDYIWPVLLIVAGIVLVFGVKKGK
ncbi:MAG: hypothetical protein LBS07_01575 [Prevotellaceae bacterium]|jgi:hypothetical protein|nr:hypothetical protein [Prevotellaceae bacterium]